MNAPNQNMTSVWNNNKHWLAKLVAALLILLALYWLAKAIWLWVDYAQPKTISGNNTEQIVRTATTKVNANKIASLHLFGEASQNNQAVEEVVGETRLNLKLLGVYVDSEKEKSSAIIQTGGSKEKVYWLGDKLQVSGRSNVTLKRVEPLKVIINNNGKNETLTLLEQLNKTIIGSKAKTEDKSSEVRDGKTIDKTRDSRLTKDLQDMRDKLTTSPQSYADLARFEPVVDNNGQVAGFKIAPGKNPQMFSRLGLRRNDVVKSINGQGLDNQAYWTALEQLQSAESLEITLERNGQPVTLLLNMGAAQTQTDPNKPRQTNNELKVQ